MVQVALRVGDFLVVTEGNVHVSTALPGRNKKTGDQKEGTAVTTAQASRLLRG